MKRLETSMILTVYSILFVYDQFISFAISFASTIIALSVISNIIIDELKEVFNKKFPHKLDVLETFLEDIEVEHININQIEKCDLFEIRDAKDYPVLYAAIKSNVDIFVTGDKDFSDLNIKFPKIMSVKDYIMTYVLR